MRAIDVRDLLAHPGASTAERLEEPVDGLGNELVEVPEDAPVAGELLLEHVVEGIFVSGPLRGPLTLTCARCLKEFDAAVRGRRAGAVTWLSPTADSDDYALDPEGELDPEPIVRDAVVLALPFSPLCRPDCMGLCERCGGNRNLGECSCTEPIDPVGRLDACSQGSDGVTRTSRERREKGTIDGRPEEEAEQAGAASARPTGRRSPPTYSECPQCHQPKLPHRVCGNCGYYAGRQAIEVE